MIVIDGAGDGVPNVGSRTYLASGNHLPMVGPNVLTRKLREEYRQHMIAEKTRIQMLKKGVWPIEKWLLDEGLVPYFECCPFHRTALGEPCKMKVIFDAHEIGWRCENCTDIIPLMKGSIFEGVFLQPTMLLLLVWHWAKTDTLDYVHKETNVSLKHITLVFRCIRGLCAVKLHRRPERLGQEGDIVQVGFTNFPVRDKNGVTRFTREVVAALEPRRSLLRMRVYDFPGTEEKRHEERLRALQLLPRWLAEGAQVAADMVDERVLRELGFKVCRSTSFPDPNTWTIMSYLTGKLPSMFEKCYLQRNGTTLRLAPMQLFLDELAWREYWGQDPFLAYSNILNHIAAITQVHDRYPSGVFPKTPRFVDWLMEVVRNPFRDWSCEPDGDIQVISEGSPGEGEKCNTSRQRKQSAMTSMDKVPKLTAEDSFNCNISRRTSNLPPDSVVKTCNLAASIIPDTVRRNDIAGNIKWYSSPESPFLKQTSRIHLNANSRVSSAPAPRQPMTGLQRPRLSQTPQRTPQKSSMINSPKISLMNQSRNNSQIHQPVLSCDERNIPQVAPVSAHRIQPSVNLRIHSSHGVRIPQKHTDQNLLPLQTTSLQDNLQVRPVVQSISAVPPLRVKQGTTSVQAIRVDQPFASSRSTLMAPSSTQPTLNPAHSVLSPTRLPLINNVLSQKNANLFGRQNSEPSPLKESPSPRLPSRSNHQELPVFLPFQRTLSPIASSMAHTLDSLPHHSYTNTLEQRGPAYQHPWNNFTNTPNFGIRPTRSPTHILNKQVPRRQVTNQSYEIKHPVKRQHTSTLQMQSNLVRQNGGLHISNGQHHSLFTNRMILQPCSPQQILVPGKPTIKLGSVSNHHENGDTRRCEDTNSGNPPKRIRHVKMAY